MSEVTTKGTVKKAACPWCGHLHDFEEVLDYALEPGAKFKCECTASVETGGCVWAQPSQPHQPGCGRFFVITRVVPTTIVFLARARG